MMKSALYHKISRTLAILLLLFSLDISFAAGQTKKAKNKAKPATPPPAANVQMSEKERPWWGFPWLVAGVLTVLPVVVCLKKFKPTPTQE